MAKKSKMMRVGFDFVQSVDQLSDRTQKKYGFVVNRTDITDLLSTVVNDIDSIKPVKYKNKRGFK